MSSVVDNTSSIFNCGIKTNFATAKRTVSDELEIQDSEDDDDLLIRAILNRTSMPN